MQSLSAEPQRRKAYSCDLRWRMVYQRIGMQLSLSTIISKYLDQLNP